MLSPSSKHELSSSNLEIQLKPQNSSTSITSNNDSPSSNPDCFDSARTQIIDSQQTECGLAGTTNPESSESTYTLTPIHNKYASLGDLEDILNGEAPLPVLPNVSSTQLISRPNVDSHALSERKNTPVLEDAQISINNKFFPLGNTEPLRIIKPPKTNLGMNMPCQTQLATAKEAVAKITKETPPDRITEPGIGTTTGTIGRLVTATALTTGAEGTETETETIIQEPVFNNLNSQPVDSNDIPVESENNNVEQESPEEKKSLGRAGSRYLNITKLEEKKSQRVQLIILSSILALLLVLSVYFIVGLSTPM